MKKKIYQFIFFRLMGWKIEGTFDKNIKKCVAMVLPHTSWHDFYLGVFTRGITGVEINWVGKKELFRFPFGAYFRWMGGAPLDRTGNLNKVDSIASIFDDYTEFRLGIAPEGTREKVSDLKSGFYYIALKANVPIVPVAFDFGAKRIKIGRPFYPTNNYENDLKILLDHFKGVTGKNTELGYQIIK